MVTAGIVKPTACACDHRRQGASLRSAPASRGCGFCVGGRDRNGCEPSAPWLSRLSFATRSSLRSISRWLAKRPSSASATSPSPRLAGDSASITIRSTRPCGGTGREPFEPEGVPCTALSSVTERSRRGGDRARRAIREDPLPSRRCRCRWPQGKSKRVDRRSARGHRQDYRESRPLASSLILPTRGAQTKRLPTGSP